MSLPMVSVIITTFNRAKLLQGAIQSVLNQTFSDWELVIADDGSTDDTGRVVQGIALADSRIRYVRWTNGGLSAARAKALPMTRGRYVALLDDDDVYLPHKLSCQVEYMETHPAVGLLYSYVELVDAEGNVIDTWPRKPTTSFHDMISHCPIQTLGILARKECLESAGGFYAGGLGCDDIDLWLRVARSSVVAFLPETVGRYRKHPGTMSQGRKDGLVALERVYKRVLGLPLSREECAVARMKYAHIMYQSALRATERQEWLTAGKRFTQAIYFCPGIGKKIKWGRYDNQLYRLSRPYVASVLCLVIGLCTMLFMPAKKRL